MGIFNSLLKGLGFAEEENVNEQSFEQDIIIKDNEQKQPSKDTALSTLKTYSPNNNKDVKLIVDNLKSGEASIVNLQNLKNVEQTRILDFLSGAVYAVNGKINKLQDGLFVVLPLNVNIVKM